MGQVPEYIRRRLEHVRDRRLKELDLSNLRKPSDPSLTKLPEEVCDLEWLETLNLAGHSLTMLPESIRRLRNLTTLHLSGNHLTSIPDGLLELHNLTRLYLSDNRLSVLPDGIGHLSQMASLNLRGNQLRSLPDTLYRLKNLRWLDVDENPLETPPPEVVKNGVDAIKDYFRQINFQGTDHLYEAKLIIVGEGGAGKTTLASKIIDQTYQLRDEDSTRGIDITPWTFLLEGSRPFRVNIWDFGGQEIYHATHQFFLTKRSLYALVADARKEDTDFYYWLSVVDLLSDHSPVLIINNEKQDRRREIDGGQLRGQFANLKETLPANLATNRGLPEVLGTIKHYISHLPHIGTRLPKTWVAVREELESDPRNHITLSEYFDICQRSGFTEMSDKLQLSSYLHDLGVVLHFQDDALLRKTIILKPRWGTHAVYKVLDSPIARSQYGKFNRADLSSIWAEPEYADMRDELLQLMVNFKLAYRIPDSEFYIAPQLLTLQEPRQTSEADRALLLRYEYEFMPKGILTQFIVTMHTLIAEQEHVWRTGVILTHEGTEARVVEHYGQRQIQVRVAGRRKRELLTIVTYELDRIHHSYPRLRVNKLVPCNCKTCASSTLPHFYKFEVLQKFWEDRQKVQCQKSYQMVHVGSLLDDISDSWRAKPDPQDLGTRDQVFISYSHADHEWCEALLRMLKPKVREDRLSVFVDTMIQPGEPWRVQLETGIASARVAVLLVSDHFLASEFIAAYELQPMLDACARQGLKILWVPLSHCLYNDSELAQYQAVISPEKPLDSMTPSERNRALVKICEEIGKTAAS
jgi:GTPase SAR1 family protein